MAGLPNGNGGAAERFEATDAAGGLAGSPPCQHTSLDSGGGRLLAHARTTLAWHRRRSRKRFATRCSTSERVLPARSPSSRTGPRHGSAPPCRVCVRVAVVAARGSRHPPAGPAHTPALATALAPCRSRHRQGQGQHGGMSFKGIGTFGLLRSHPANTVTLNTQRTTQRHSSIIHALPGERVLVCLSSHLLADALGDALLARVLYEGRHLLTRFRITRTLLLAPATQL